MAEFLHSVMAATAWGMERPASYGVFHLTFLFVGLAVSFLLAFLLRKTREKGFKAVMLTCGLFLLVTEVYKQLFYVYYVNYTVPAHYVWWIFPFQLCSIPMYFCIVAAILKPGKVREAICDFMLAFNLMGGAVAFAEPSGLTHEYWTLTLHAFIWHMMLVFVGLYLGFSKRAGLRLKNYVRALCIFAALCVVAFLINLIFWNASEGSINMFYVGPKTSPIIVFKDIATKFGWYVNTPIYMVCLSIAAFVFYLPWALLNEKRSKKREG